MGLLEEALPFYGTSLQLRWDLGDRTGEGWMLHRLARIYAVQGKSDRTRKHADQAAAIAAEVEDKKLLKACRRLANY